MIGNKFVGRSDSPLSIAGHKEVTIENRPTDSSSTETQPLQHKLAAILYADVEGYSRLTGADEAGTHRTLITSCFQDETNNGTMAGWPDHDGSTKGWWRKRGKSSLAPPT